jgi:hypothetical protein
VTSLPCGLELLMTSSRQSIPRCCIKVFDEPQSSLFAALPARKGIDHIGDSFELGCESPRFVRRKHRVGAVEIDMHLVVKYHSIVELC